MIPPWLDIQPANFLAATEAGTRVGMAIADRQLDAQERAAARAERSAERGAALNQQANEAQANRDLREWELNQRHQLAAQELAQQGQQNEATLALRQQYELAQMDARNRALDQRARDASRPQFRTVRGQGLVAVNPATGGTEVVLPEGPGATRTLSPSNFGRMVDERDRAAQEGNAEKVGLYNTYLTHLSRDPSGASMKDYIQKQLLSAQHKLAAAQAGSGSAMADPSELPKAKAGVDFWMKEYHEKVGGTNAPAPDLAPIEVTPTTGTAPISSPLRVGNITIGGPVPSLNLSIPSGDEPPPPKPSADESDPLGLFK